MKVSVVVGAYNNALHIEHALRSVIRQTEGEWNCLVVDNGSTDDTITVAREVVRDDPRFTVVRKENQGPGSGRNFGHQMVKGQCEFIHFLDGDDVLHPDFLQVMTTYLQDNPHVGLVGCQYSLIDESGHFLKHATRSRFAPGLFGLPRMLRVEERNTPFETFFSATGQGPFALFRASLFEKTTGYEEDFWSHEDSDIFCQMALLAEVHFLPDRLYLKRIYSTNLSRSPKANYQKFRQKWDAMRTVDPVTNQRIGRALVYYYRMHAPMRDFMMSAVALAEFVKRPSWGCLRWSASCFRHGVLGLMFGIRHRRI